MSGVGVQLISSIQGANAIKTVTVVSTVRSVLWVLPEGFLAVKIFTHQNMQSLNDLSS